MKIKTVNQFYQCVEKELFENITSFWLTNTKDEEKGGFYGRISNDLHIDKNAYKSLILNARILWTFSHLYDFRAKPEYIETARLAYTYIKKHFYDAQYGGMFWMVDSNGNVISDKKKIYGQAFSIYALSAFFAITQDQQILDEAIEIYNLIEKYNYDPKNHGYFETSNRDWTIAEDLRLSEVDMNEMKSMNTHLHLMEAYTSLYKVWPDTQLRQKLKDLVYVFQTYILDTETFHFKLFFDDKWNSKSQAVSFGHDIEGSWLICEAVDVLNDEDLQKQIRPLAIDMAKVTALEGLSDRYTIYTERNGDGSIYNKSDWWQQAEMIVGFVNAYEISKDEYYLDLAMKCWQAVEEYFVDRENGEWFYEIDDKSKPDMKQHKVSEWKGPYHNGRACIELLERLKPYSR